jgi:hypothetical protein
MDQLLGSRPPSPKCYGKIMSRPGTILSWTIARGAEIASIFDECDPFSAIRFAPTTDIGIGGRVV